MVYNCVPNLQQKKFMLECTNIYSSVVSAGHAVREAEERQYQQYGALEVHFRFVPVAAEAAGVHG